MRLIYTLDLTKLLTKLLKQIESQAKFNKRKNTTYCYAVLPKILLVEMIGFEPMTLCLQGRCSSQLSHTPKCFMMITYLFFFVKKNQQKK